MAPFNRPIPSNKLPVNQNVKRQQQMKDEGDEAQQYNTPQQSPQAPQSRKQGLPPSTGTVTQQKTAQGGRQASLDDVRVPGAQAENPSDLRFNRATLPNAKRPVISADSVKGNPEAIARTRQSATQKAPDPSRRELLESIATDLLGNSQRDTTRERDLVRENSQAATGAAIADTRARASRAGAGLSGAASAQEADIRRKALRDLTAQELGIEQSARDERLRNIQAGIAAGEAATSEDAFNRILDLFDEGSDAVATDLSDEELDQLIDQAHDDLPDEELPTSEDPRPLFEDTRAPNRSKNEKYTHSQRDANGDIIDYYIDSTGGKRKIVGYNRRTNKRVA